MKRWKMAVIGALLVVPAVSVSAAGAASVIKQRQANFSVMGKSMKSISDELKKPNADLATIRASVSALNGAASKVKNHFPKGSGPEAGVKTDALPVIWTKAGEFKLKAERLVATTKSLKMVSATGDLAKIGAAMGAVGGSCKSCHDDFRKPRS